MSSWLLWPWRRREKQRGGGPARQVPTDTVIPLASFDDSPQIRPLVMHLLMRFDDMLDADALARALEALLSRHDGWRRLGARLRLNHEGLLHDNKLEYHVPAAFDRDRRPAVAYHHQRFDTSIHEHPVAAALPPFAEAASQTGADDVPQPVPGDPDRFLSLMRKDGDPTTLEDYLDSDRPLLGLHVVSFDDATLLTLSWSHVVLDAMGLKALLDAWSLVLHGRDAEVPPLYGFAADPLAALGSEPREEYKLADRQLGTWQLLVLGARVFLGRLWSPPSQELTRMIMIPASFAQRLRDTARADLASSSEQQQQQQQPPASASSSSPPKPVPFVSEGDVICAWWNRRLVGAQLPPTSRRTVAVHNVFNLRGVLGGDLLPQAPGGGGGGGGGVYVSNAVIAVPTLLPARELLTRPLGHVAAALRGALRALGTRAQVEALVAGSRAAAARGGAFVVGDAWMHITVCSNWTKGKFFDVDFSGAVVKKPSAPSGTGARSGRPSYMQPHTFANGSPVLTDACSVMGKDGRGNIWLMGRFHRRYWPAIEEALAKGAV